MPFSDIERPHLADVYGDRACDFRALVVLEKQPQRGAIVVCGELASRVEPDGAPVGEALGFELELSADFVGRVGGVG